MFCIFRSQAPSENHKLGTCSFHRERIESERERLAGKEKQASYTPVVCPVRRSAVLLIHVTVDRVTSEVYTASVGLSSDHTKTLGHLTLHSKAEPGLI